MCVYVCVRVVVGTKGELYTTILSNDILNHNHTMIYMYTCIPIKF